MSRDTLHVEGAGGVDLVVDITTPAGQIGEPGFLLVHGLASNARLWDGVARFLEETGLASAAVDLRGHGRSGKPDDGYDYDTLCADLESVMRTFTASSGVSGVVAVGQSFGGNLVIELGARHPAGLVGVACVDGGMLDLAARFATFEEVERELAPPKLVGMPGDDLEQGLREMHPDWPDEGIAGTMANLELRADGTVAPWLTLARHLAILRTMWSARPGDAYPEIDVPVLFMPAESPGAPAEWLEGKREGVQAAAAALSDVEVLWFSPADHDVHAQHPREVGEALVRRFVRPAT